MPDPDPMPGEVVDDGGDYSVVEVCAICGVDDQLVMALVSYGVIEPRGDEPPAWRFSESALQRSKKAVRLRRDLELDWAGLALVLDLLDEIDRLRLRLAGRGSGG